LEVSARIYSDLGPILKVNIEALGGDMTKLIGTTLLFLAMAGFTFAAIPATPEIDPATGVSALALLSGGLLVLRARRKK
jgi:uncharacterized protein (TIGR03382 family)